MTDEVKTSLRKTAAIAAGFTANAGAVGGGAHEGRGNAKAGVELGKAPNATQRAAETGPDTAVRIVQGAATRDPP